MQLCFNKVGWREKPAEIKSPLLAFMILVTLFPVVMHIADIVLYVACCCNKSYTNV